MLIKIKQWLPAILLTTALVAPGLASAATTTWNWDFDGASGSYASNESGGANLDVNGYSDSNDVYGQDTIEAAPLDWSGSSYGLHVSGEAGHGISGHKAGSDDNGWDDLESVVFGWGGQAVTLTEVSIGWYEHGYDFTLMRYSGVGAPSLVGDTYTDLASSSSWDLVGSIEGTTGYSSGSVTTVDLTGLPGFDMEPASYYLLSISNPFLDPSASGPYYGTSWNGEKKYTSFKLLGASGKTSTPPSSTPGIPVPATAFLFALGMPCLWLLRRRKS